MTVPPPPPPPTDVGSDVGDATGDADGSAVGGDVGNAVGDAVGSAVGGDVGGAVGDAVVCTVGVDVAGGQICHPDLAAEKSDAQTISVSGVTPFGPAVPAYAIPFTVSLSYVDSVLNATTRISGNPREMVQA